MFQTGIVYNAVMKGIWFGGILFCLLETPKLFLAHVEILNGTLQKLQNIFLREVLLQR